MANSRNKKNRTALKCFLAIIIIILVGIGVWRIFIYTPTSKIIVKVGNAPKTSTNNSSKSSNTTQKNPANNSATGDSGTNSNSSTNTSNSTTTQIGGSIDTNGQSNSTTPSSEWTTSASGLITVEQPTANATLSSGDVLIGTAKVSNVDYTLIDNTVGVISQGTLNVNDGKFSGNIVFSSHSSSGRLDIYSTNSQGVELNEVQIGVYF